ncbi:MAG: hypothetical protein RL291_1523 [Pseudomonadota bacterium]
MPATSDPQQSRGPFAASWDTISCDNQRATLSTFANNAVAIYATATVLLGERGPGKNSVRDRVGLQELATAR